MKVLLVNPPMTNMIKSTISSFIDSIVVDNPMPPLGLMYLASYVLKHTKHEVRICDMVVGNDLQWYLREYNPNVVGITTTTLTLYDAWQVANTCKLYNSKVVTILGGAHCSIYPEETINLEGIDYVVRGDGEVPIVNILNSIDSSNSIDRVNSIDIIENLDSIPFPARHLIDNSKYHSVLSKGKLVTSMITSRGCPYNCSFCYQPHYKKWRAMLAGNVVSEMIAIDQLGINEIEIYDDTFTYDRNRVLKVCNEIISLNKSFPVYWWQKPKWSIRTRVDKVDQELLQVMKDAGCTRINYGIESITPSVLKTLRKSFTVQQAIDAIEWTKEAGIKTQAYFMLGSPNETREQMLDTIRFANEYIPDYAYYSITSPMPGTDLYTLELREGKYNNYWKEFAMNPTKDFKIRFWNEENREELIKLFNYGYKSFYSKPSRILKQLVNTKSISEFARKCKLAIGVLK